MLRKQKIAKILICDFYPSLLVYFDMKIKYR